MEIKPGIGIDEVKLGMTREQVLDILGPPDDARIDEEMDNDVYIYYNSLRLRLRFESEENFVLTKISTTNPDAAYRGFPIIGQPIEFAKDVIFNDLATDWLIDEYEVFDTHFNEQYWFNLDTEFGTVTEIQLGVPISEDDEFIWPE